LEAGQGEPTILIHGGDGEASNWAQLMTYLQPDLKLYAVDRPGFGLSDPFDYKNVNLRQHAADFVASFLDALDLKSANVIGGSMGGFFALAATLAHPHRVNKLFLIGYAAGATKSLPIPLKIICGVPGLAKLFMKGRDSMKAQKNQYKGMFHTDLTKVPELLLELRIAGIRLPSEQGTWARLLPRVANLRGIRPEIYLGDELKNITQASLMIMGQYDMATPKEGKAVMGKIPNGKFEYIPGVGHFPFVEAPEKTAEFINNFLIQSK